MQRQYALRDVGMGLYWAPKSVMIPTTCPTTDAEETADKLSNTGNVQL